MELMKLNIQLFAASASNSKTLWAPASSKNGYTLKASFSETSTNTTNNTSTVSCTASLGASHISYSVTNGGTLAIYWHDNRENKDVLIKSEKINSCGMSYGTKSVSGSKTVTHNNDGTLSGYAKAVFTKGSGTYVPASGNVSTANTALTKIPRAAKIEAVSGNIGSKPTITITPAASGLNYTYTVTYNVGGNSGTIQTKSTTTSITTWTIPNSFYQTCSNVTQISGTIYCSTWSGNTQIGDTQSNTFTVKVPTSAKPTVRPLVIGTEIVDTDIVSRDVIQEFVVGRSKLQYNMVNAYSSNYYADADKYTLKINNVSVTQNSTYSTYTRSDTISGTSGTYEVIITDKRGNSGTSGVQNITAYTYNSPQCNFTIERDDTVASTVIIKYSGSITNINNNNNNTKKFKMEYKITNPSAQDTWHTIFDITDSYSINNTMTLPNIDDDKTYIFVMTAIDSYGDATKSTATIELPTSATLINFSANGDALAFGKASELPNTFECNLKSDFKKEVNINGELYLADNNGDNKIRVGHIVNGQRLLECSGTNGTSGVYIKLCHISLASHLQGRFNNFKIFIGDGNNGRVDQQAYIDLSLQQGWQGSEGGRFGGTWELHPMKTSFKLSNTNIIVISDTNLEYDVWFYTTIMYCRPSYIYNVDEGTIITHIGNVTQTTAPSGTAILCEGVEISKTDTGWRDFSWRNSTYTTGNTYTQNKWRVKNGVLYIQVGAGSTSAINTSAEIEIARIPITGNTSFNNSSTRIWNGAVGSGGSVAGFIVMQNTDYISVYIKPHVSSSFYAGNWYSTHFAIPLDSTSSIL